MALSTTGTLQTTAWDTRTVIDRAYGALGLTPQQVVGEKIQIALDLLGITLADMVNTSHPLWTLEKIFITPIQGQPKYQLPQGTNDVNRGFYRTVNNITPTLIASGPSAWAYDFGLVNGVNNDTQVCMWAITWLGVPVPVTFQSSEDNATWSNVYSTNLLNYNYNGAGSTQFYEMDNQLPRRYWRVIPQVVVPPNTLSITSAALYNTPNDIQMYRMNKDDYWNMTNVTFPGRPLQYWVDRQLTPNVQVWAVPDAISAANVMRFFRQRMIQDVGSLQQAIEVPTRWFWTVIIVLADALAMCTPEAKPDSVQMVQARLPGMLMKLWTEERDKSPLKLGFNLRQYTR